MAKYLVTGSNGFIGSNIVKTLIEEGHSVRGLVRKSSNLSNLAGLPIEKIEGDIRDFDTLQPTVEGIDGIFHTAAIYRFWAPRYDMFYDTNVDGTLNVLEAAENANVDKVVFTSTASLLAHSDDHSSLPSSTDELPSTYKVTKYIAEKEALKYHQNNQLDVVIASPTVPIGPGDYGPTPTGRLILDFLNGRMKGYLDMNFNIIDVEDVAEGHLLAMQNGEPGKRYVLGNQNTTLSEVLEIVSKITGLRKPTFQIPYHLALTFAWIDEFFEGFLLRRRPLAPVSAIESTKVNEHIDATPWTKELGLPQTPITKALKKAIDWFVTNGYVKHGGTALSYNDDKAD